jgi:hypothetical protein
MNQHFIFLQRCYFLKNNEWVFINHNCVTILDVALTDLIPEAFGSGINSMRQHFIFLQNVIFFSKIINIWWSILLIRMLKSNLQYIGLIWEKIAASVWKWERFRCRRIFAGCFSRCLRRLALESPCCRLCSFLFHSSDCFWGRRHRTTFFLNH